MRKNLLPNILVCMAFWWVMLTYIHISSGDYVIFENEYPVLVEMVDQDGNLLVDEDGTPLSKEVMIPFENLNLWEVTGVFFSFWWDMLNTSFQYMFLTIFSLFGSVFVVGAGIAAERSGIKRRLKSDSHRGMVVSMGRFPPRPVLPASLDIRPGFLELFPESVGNWICELKEPHRELAMEILRIFNAHRRYPAHWAKGGHGNKSLLKHTGNVIHFILTLQKDWVDKTTGEKVFNEDDGIPGLIALAHDLGKLECYKQDDKGEWIEIYGDHDARSARMLSRMESFWKLPDYERSSLLTVVNFYHRSSYMPVGGVYNDNLMAILNAADTKAGMYEEMTVNADVPRSNVAIHPEFKNLRLPHEYLEDVQDPGKERGFDKPLDEVAKEEHADDTNTDGVSESSEQLNEASSDVVVDIEPVVSGQEKVAIEQKQVDDVSIVADAKIIAENPMAVRKEGKSRTTEVAAIVEKSKPYWHLLDSYYSEMKAVLSDEKSFTGFRSIKQNIHEKPIAVVGKIDGQSVVILNMGVLKATLLKRLKVNNAIPDEKAQASRFMTINDLLILKAAEVNGILYRGQSETKPEFYNSLYRVVWASKDPGQKEIVRVALILSAPEVEFFKKIPPVEVISATTAFGVFKSGTAKEVNERGMSEREAAYELIKQRKLSETSGAAQENYTDVDNSKSLGYDREKEVINSTEPSGLGEGSGGTGLGNAKDSRSTEQGGFDTRQVKVTEQNSKEDAGQANAQKEGPNLGELRAPMDMPGVRREWLIDKSGIEDKLLLRSVELRLRKTVECSVAQLGVIDDVLNKLVCGSVQVVGISKIKAGTGYVFLAPLQGLQDEIAKRMKESGVAAGDAPYRTVSSSTKILTDSYCMGVVSGSSKSVETQTSRVLIVPHGLKIGEFEEK